MRIFDWTAHARRRWFIPDGIHYYTPGYIARTQLIARGFAAAFPRSGPAIGLRRELKRGCGRSAVAVDQPLIAPSAVILMTVRMLSAPSTAIIRGARIV
jgi:hypothetical protein